MRRGGVGRKGAIVPVIIKGNSNEKYNSSDSDDDDDGGGCVHFNQSHGWSHLNNKRMDILLRMNKHLS